MALSFHPQRPCLPWMLDTQSSDLPPGPCPSGASRSLMKMGSLLARTGSWSWLCSGSR